MTDTTNERKFHVVLGTGPLAQGVMRALLRRDKSVRMVNRRLFRTLAAPGL